MQAIAISPVALLLRGGASSIIGLSMHGAVFAPGMQAGLGLLLRMDRRAAVRLDVSRHWFYSDNVISRAWSIGIGLVALPPAAGAGPR